MAIGLATDVPFREAMKGFADVVGGGGGIGCEAGSKRTGEVKEGSGSVGGGFAFRYISFFFHLNQFMKLTVKAASSETVAASGADAGGGFAGGGLACLRSNQYSRQNRSESRMWPEKCDQGEIMSSSLNMASS